MTPRDHLYEELLAQLDHTVETLYEVAGNLEKGEIISGCVEIGRLLQYLETAIHHHQNYQDKINDESQIN